MDLPMSNRTQTARWAPTSPEAVVKTKICVPSVIIWDRTPILNPEDRRPVTIPPEPQQY